MSGKATAAGVLVVTIIVLTAGVSHADVFNMPNGQTSLDFVTVGDPGNSADTTGYGAVGYTYQMGTYDVTLGQYAAFLNAVATSGDPYGLYNSKMAIAFAVYGIARSGTAGSYTYAITGTATGKYNFPIVGASWGDAARFCNWLQNGQPAGTEGNGTTETGVYTLSGATSGVALMAVTRNTTANYFIPAENEWYKAAYYKGGSTNSGYWKYPTQSNIAPVNILSSVGTNNANFYDYYGTGNGTYTDTTNYQTPVGCFVGSPGPYGTYDMGGDVWQWDEANIHGTFRGLRGGSSGFDSDYLASSYRRTSGYNPSTEIGDIGFRVGSSVATPEPSSIALLLAGALAFAIWRRRRTP